MNYLDHSCSVCKLAREAYELIAELEPLPALFSPRQLLCASLAGQCYRFGLPGGAGPRAGPGAAREQATAPLIKMPRSMTSAVRPRLAPPPKLEHHYHLWKRSQGKFGSLTIN